MIIGAGSAERPLSDQELASTLGAGLESVDLAGKRVIAMQPWGRSGSPPVSRRSTHTWGRLATSVLDSAFESSIMLGIVQRHW